MTGEKKKWNLIFKVSNDAQPPRMYTPSVFENFELNLLVVM